MSLIFGIGKFFCFSGLCRFFLSIFLSHSIENFRRGALLCCVSEKFMVAKTFLDKRVNHDFPWNVFCLTETKLFARDPSSVSLF